MDLNVYRTKSFRRLVAKVSQAKEELFEAEIVAQNAQNIFISGINSFCKEHNISNPLHALSEQKQKKDKVENEEFDEFYNTENSSLKKTWKQTISKVHPDKGGDSEILDKLVKAKKDKDFLTILQIAKENDIDIPVESFAQIEILEKQLEDIEKKINQIHESFPWRYFIAEPKKKEKIIEDFFRTLGVIL